MNCRCRTARVCSSSSPSESIGDPISNSGSEFSINFLHLVRESALLKSHLVKSSVMLSVHLHALLHPLQVSLQPHLVQLPRNLHRESYTHPPSPFQCRLSFHCCCCYYCPQLEALLDAPCASLTLLLFDGCICHVGLLFQAPFCKWRSFKWRWRRRWRRWQRRTAATAPALPSPDGARGCPPSPSGRCLLR